LDGRLAFPGIAQTIETVLAKTPNMRLGTMDDVLAADAEARRLAREVIEARRGKAE
jgi:1-deoxy-D-xylulose-5-phosphate reductoisomerase